MFLPVFSRRRRRVSSVGHSSSPFWSLGTWTIGGDEESAGIDCDGLGQNVILTVATEGWSAVNTATIRLEESPDNAQWSALTSDLVLTFDGDSDHAVAVRTMRYVRVACTIDGMTPTLTLVPTVTVF